MNVLNPNAPAPPEFVQIYQTTQFDAIYQLENQGKQQYDSAEIALHQSFGKGYEWMASYTRSRAYSNAVADVTVDQPMLISNNAGPLALGRAQSLFNLGLCSQPIQELGDRLSVRDSNRISILGTG